MSRSSFGGLLLVVGLVLVGLFTFVVDLPSGLDFIAIFLLGVVPTVVGAALLRATWRQSSQKQSPEAQRTAAIKDQIVWRAVAQGGHITASEASDHLGVTPLEVEHALLALVSEGRALAEPGETGEVMYRIDSPVKPSR